MKTSRITLAALLLLVLAAMTSCEQGKEKGVAMGVEFAKAWTGDDQALDQQVLKVTAALDSLTFKSAFADYRCPCRKGARERRCHGDWRPVQ